VLLQVARSRYIANFIAGGQKRKAPSTTRLDQMEVPDSLDYYEVLGLERGASVQEIRQSFRRLAKMYHPDKRSPGSSVDAKDFRDVSPTTDNAATRS
jgi:hypothetical protein